MTGLTAAVPDDQVASFLQVDRQQEGPERISEVLRQNQRLVADVTLDKHTENIDHYLLYREG